MRKAKKRIIICSVAGFVAITLIIWTFLGFDYMGPFQALAPWKVENQYNTSSRQNEIVFYGASNFARWNDMESDLSGYKVQNHGFGGSTDKALAYYASKLLYPYHPKVVFFQTGSNDYVQLKGTDDEKVKKCMDYKKQMFATFHQKLPDAKFVVMSGLLLPGRNQYTAMTEKINNQLKELCENSNYMYFVDASKLTYDGTNYRKDLFVSDGIHFNRTGQKAWATGYIIPTINKVISDMGESGQTLKK
jgi:Lysophospholipase L1 and related esterases